MAGEEVRNCSSDTSDEHKIVNEALKERGLSQHCEWWFSVGSMEEMIIVLREKQ